MAWSLFNIQTKNLSKTSQCSSRIILHIIHTAIPTKNWAFDPFYINWDSPDRMTVASSLNWTQLTFCEQKWKKEQIKETEKKKSTKNTGTTNKHKILLKLNWNNKNQVTLSCKQQNWPQRDLLVCGWLGLWRRPTGSLSCQSCRNKSGCCHRNCGSSQWEKKNQSLYSAEHISLSSLLVCLQFTIPFWYNNTELIFLTCCGGRCENYLTYLHPEPHIHGHCMFSAGSLGSHSTALEICHCHKIAGSSHQLTRQGDIWQFVRNLQHRSTILTMPVPPIFMCWREI